MHGSAIRKKSLVGGLRALVKAIAQREEYHVAGWVCQLWCNWRASFAQTMQRRHRAFAGHSYLATVAGFVVGRTRDGSPVLGVGKESKPSAI